jgi:dethiobiotin synthetase
MTGLAAALRDEGFATQAFKPLVFGSFERAQAELSFIGTISRTPLRPDIQFLERERGFDLFKVWQLIEGFDSGFTLFEMPGSCAMPIGVEQSDDKPPADQTWKDNTDLAREFGIPCLLVARHAGDAYEKLVLNATYLLSRRVRVVGLVTVETGPLMGAEMEIRMSRDVFAMTLKRHTGIDYIGCLKYSPSISVEHVKQGNLIKMTQAGVDLLFLLKALNLNLPMNA